MSGIKFWAVFAVGVAAGATVALIYAPQTGARTRRQLRRSFEDAGEFIKDTTSTLNDRADKYIKRSKSVMSDAAETAQDVVNAAKKVAQFS